MHDHIKPEQLEAGRTVQVHIYGGKGLRTARVTAVERLPKVGLIPYTVHVFTLLFEDESTAEVTNLGAMFWTPEYQSFGWCPQCRRRTEIQEASDESSYEGHHEIGYFVTRFVCGHETQSEGRIIGSSPGGESVAEALAGAQIQDRLKRSSRWND